jgi:hypothetical protein
MRAAEGSNRFAQRVKYPGAGVAIRQARVKDRNVFVTLAPRFKRLWTEAKLRLPNYVPKTPHNPGDPIENPRTGEWG